MKTRLTELLGIERPIIQGGLAYLAYAGLAAAVCEAGGLGQISAASMPDGEALRREIRLLRSLTSRPFAVNFAIGHRPLDEFLDIALSEGISIISVTGGNPEALFKRADSSGVAVHKLALVAGTRQAQKAESLGAAAVIAVGFEGGGHIGRDDVGTLVLVPRVVDSVSIPVVASGGIGDGRGLAAALCLGAQGIEMGTRFVATQECIAGAAYKQALLNAKESDTILIERSFGRPGRALRTIYTEGIVRAESDSLATEEILPMVSGQANRRAAIDGDLEHGFVWAGQVTGMIVDVPTVGSLLDRIVADAERILEQASGLFSRS
jgi:NAD(P)H-dependent flavin oxidoreductase YrpB (nitropropane dioxygenase family)